MVHAESNARFHRTMIRPFGICGTSQTRGSWLGIGWPFAIGELFFLQIFENAFTGYIHPNRAPFAEVQMHLMIRTSKKNLEFARIDCDNRNRRVRGLSAPSR
jgi:hypothetical protein